VPGFSDEPLVQFTEEEEGDNGLLHWANRIDSDSERFYPDNIHDALLPTSNNIDGSDLDPFAAAKNDSDCSLSPSQSSSSPPPRSRPRARRRRRYGFPILTTPTSSISAPTEEVPKKWCLEFNSLGFQNIRVCRI
jgi:hypothetical protein